MQSLANKKNEMRLGYLKEGDNLTFLFDPEIYKDKLEDIDIKKVKLNGSFTSWKVKWDFDKRSDNLWVLEKDFKDVNIPGNSGYPEFRFVINNEVYLDAPEELYIDNKFYDSHSGGYKLVILKNKKDSKKIEKINKRILDYKKKYSSKEELANFRFVKGGDLGKEAVYRSYHPFKKSRSDHPREEDRLEAVQELIKEKGIKSIINLSDTDEDIPAGLDYYKALVQSGNVLFTNKGYNYDVFYYLTDNNDFSQLLRRIIDFIIDPDNRTPFLIHCRIGTDRTGVIGAILAAVMGANWKEILKDYQSSNKLGIGEYRDEELLAHAFKGLVGNSYKENLSEKIDNYLLNDVGLSKAELSELKNKLK